MSSDDARAAAAVERVHRRLRHAGVDLPVRRWDGVDHGPMTSTYRLVLRHPWSLRAMAVPPNDLAAGTAFVRGDVEVEGSLVDALHDIARLRTAADLGWSDRLALARDVLLLPRPPRTVDEGRRARFGGDRHSRGRDADAVRFHYDVGNDYYRLFLDDRLVYSCAYFVEGEGEDPGADPLALDRAQERKLDLVCRKLDLRPGERMLDIGCGWGALVTHAAEHYGVTAVGITISPRQADLARERVAAAGLDDRVEIRVDDYRDVTGRFDAVASIGMFEHVGPDRFTEYFATAHARTVPGGRFLNHAITTGRRTEVRDLADARDSFIGAYVFPDGALAPASTAARLMEEAGFELHDVEQLRRHYARTLRHWLHRLGQHEQEAIAVAGPEIQRVWRAYMAGSVVGFESGDLGVVQMLGVRPPVRVPLDRSWMTRRLRSTTVPGRR